MRRLLPGPAKQFYESNLKRANLLYLDRQHKGDFMPVLQV
jgi:hypothetical protein